MSEARARGQGQVAPDGGKRGKGTQGNEATGGGQVALAVGGGIIVGLVLVAVIGAGFALSFEATREVAEASRIGHGVSWLLPVAIDGAMMIATIVAVVLRRLSQPSGYPMVVVIIGTLLSIAINGVHATAPASAVAGTLVLNAGVRCVISAIPGGMLALSVHLAAVFLDSVSGVTRTAPHATHATHATAATLRRQPVKAAPTPAPVAAEPASQAEAAPEAMPAPALEAPEAEATEPAPQPQGTDELRARRERHAEDAAYEALRAWWLTPEAKAEIGARRGNDGFPNRAEAKREGKASSAVADRIKARLRDEYAGEAATEASS